MEERPGGGGWLIHNLPFLILLLVMSCLTLAGLGFSGLLVARAQEHRQKLDARLTAAVAPHMRIQKPIMSAFTPPVVTKDRSLLGFVSWVFRFDPMKSDQYALHWGLVLVITLGLATAAEMLAGGMFGSIAPLMIPVLWVVLSRSYFGWAEGRRIDKFFEQFPEALTMIVRSVRVGIPVMEGMRLVAREAPQPTQREFAKMVEQISIGVSLEDAIQDLARRSGLAEYRFFATALALQNQTGGALSETLEGLADVIRKRVAVKARGQALASEGKTSAAILSALPVFTGLMLWMLNPAYLGMLFTDPTGKKIFGAAVFSLFLGIMIMRTMIRRSLS
jgi:tight adherence protein B